MKVGVLALQGDVREHIRALGDCGVVAQAVRRDSEIRAVDALVIPGGESTTIAKLARSFGVFEIIAENCIRYAGLRFLRRNDFAFQSRT